MGTDIIGIDDASIQVINMLLISLLGVFFISKNKIKLILHRVYVSIMVVSFLSCLIGLFLDVCYEMTTYSSSIFQIIILSEMALDIFLDVLLAACIFIHAKIDFKNEKWWMVLLIFPYIIYITLLVVSGFNGCIIRINGDGLYEIGPLFFLVYMCDFIYILMCFAVSLRFKNIIGLKKCTYIKIYSIAFILTCIMHIFLNMGGMKVFTAVIVLMIEIYGVRNAGEHFDTTDAMHRENLLESVVSDFITSKRFKLIFVKIKNFESLEKNYSNEDMDTIRKNMTRFFNGLDRSAIVYRFQQNMICIKLDDMNNDRLNDCMKAIEERFIEGWKNGDINVIFPIAQVFVKAPEDIKSVGDFNRLCKLLDYAKLSDGEVLDYKAFCKLDNSAEILDAIKYAVEHRTFKVYYQPIYSTKDKKIIAAEALIRMIDDKLGFVSPEKFIPLAEKAGYILEIGRFVFEDVCRFFSECKVKNLGIEYIEVNLSAIQCMQYGLAGEFVGIMKKYGLEGEDINFEITESSAMINNRTVTVNIKEFIKNRIKLSLDDYGTGYSNLSYLYNVPFSYVKVDKSLLWSSDKNEKAYITMANVFTMTKKLKMKVVVEGVETKEHVQKLRKLGCDFFQGYYFSKPVPGNEFVDYVKNFTLPEVCK